MIHHIETHQISRNHPYFKECDKLTFLSKNLWNATNYAVRQFYFETGKHLRYAEVNRQFTHDNQPDYRALPAKVAKGTQRLLEKAYVSFFKKSEFRRMPNYLHKTNGRQVVHYEKGALSTKIAGFVKLSKTDILIKTNKQAEFVRIVPRLDYFVIEVGYTVAEPTPSVTMGSNVASIDLGLSNLATVTSNVMTPIIINGKPVNAINHHANYLLANIQSQTNSSSHRLRAIYRKRSNKIKDYFHKSTSFLVKFFVENHIDTVVIGHNVGQKKFSKLKHFVQIPFQQFTDMLSYKCQDAGITVIIQEESYTSKSSFYDLDAIPDFGIKNTIRFSGKRVKRGLYRTKNNEYVNADVNGSLNILRKSSAWIDNMWGACVSNSRKPIRKYQF